MKVGDKVIIDPEYDHRNLSRAGFPRLGMPPQIGLVGTITAKSEFTHNAFVVDTGHEELYTWNEEGLIPVTNEEEQGDPDCDPTGECCNEVRGNTEDRIQAFNMAIGIYNPLVYENFWDVYNEVLENVFGIKKQQ